VFARQILEREINSVTDNPLIFPKANGPGENRILSGGNFHGQIIAIAMDTLAIAVAELASISEQRLQKLMNPSFSSLPPFLTLGGGLNSGFMNMQVAAASIVSENKTLCHPASVDSIPTSVDKEDHVSMGAWAARKARTVIANTRKVLTIEMMAGAQGLDLLRPLTSSPILEAIHAQIRSRVARLMGDRAFFEDFAAMDEFLTSEQLQVELQSYFGCP
jgi:histidine ammonia-lyase